MTKKLFEFFQELISEDNPRPKITKTLNILLFLELVLIGAYKFFPLYNAFLQLYPSGIPTLFITSLEFAFYISLFLCLLYTTIFIIIVVLTNITISLDEKIDYDSLYIFPLSSIRSFSSNSKNWTNTCLSNLSIVNQIYMIILLPLLVMNSSIIMECKEYYIIPFLISILILVFQIIFTFKIFFNYIFLSDEKKTR